MTVIENMLGWKKKYVSALFRSSSFSTSASLHSDLCSCRFFKQHTSGKFWKGYTKVWVFPPMQIVHAFESVIVGQRMFFYYPNVMWCDSNWCFKYWKSIIVKPEALQYTQHVFTLDDLTERREGRIVKAGHGEIPSTWEIHWTVS